MFSQPATVSRCGMIYLEPTSLGWRPIMKSWLNALPEILKKDASEVLTDVFEWLVDPCLDFIRHHCKVCASGILCGIHSTLLVDVWALSNVECWIN